MRFEVTGYREPDGVVSISFDAASSDEAKARARSEGLHVLSVERRWGGSLTRPRRARFEALRFSQELEALLDAGLSLVEALNALAAKETVPDKRSVIEQLVSSIREGQPFSLALQARPDVFPPLYVALVGAAERTGDLKSALARYIGYRGQMDAVKKKVVAASIYPLLLIGVGGLVILFLMAYVVPRFSRIYQDLGRDLPVLSQLLMHWGALIQSHGVLVLTAVLAAMGIGGQMLRRAGLQGRFLDRLLASRALRERVQAYELSRFYRTLGMLQQGGIPILVALGMAGGLLGELLKGCIAQVLIEVKSGVSLSEAMQRHRLAPPVAYDLLRVGERSGNIGEKMVRVADFFDEDLSRWMDWFSRLFEPLLMLGIGIFIAFVVVLLYLPIFELAGNLQ